MITNANQITVTPMRMGVAKIPGQSRVVRTQWGRPLPQGWRDVGWAPAPNRATRDPAALTPGECGAVKACPRRHVRADARTVAMAAFWPQSGNSPGARQWGRGQTKAAAPGAVSRQVLLLEWPANALGKENEDRLKVTQDATPFTGSTGTGSAMETERVAPGDGGPGSGGWLPNGLWLLFWGEEKLTLENM